jgi:GNAT superfamily N-acetyltransferase
MSNLYKQYIKEREDLETVEYPYGFFTYKNDLSDPEALFISDLYIIPELRRNKLGTSIGNDMVDLAKSMNLKRIRACVDMSTNKWEESLDAIQSHGYKMECIQDTIIYLIKEI